MESVEISERQFYVDQIKAALETATIREIKFVYKFITSTRSY